MEFHSHVYVPIMHSVFKKHLINNKEKIQFYFFSQIKTNNKNQLMDLKKHGSLCNYLGQRITLPLFGFLFTFEVKLFIVTMAICLPTDRTACSKSRLKIIFQSHFRQITYSKYFVLFMYMKHVTSQFVPTVVSLCQELDICK